MGELSKMLHLVIMKWYSAKHGEEVLEVEKSNLTSKMRVARLMNQYDAVQYASSSNEWHLICTKW